MNIIYLFSCENSGVIIVIFIHNLKKKILVYAFRNAAF